MKFVLLIASFCLFESAFGLFGFTKKYNTHEDPFFPHTNRAQPFAPFVTEEKWIEQRLDNFNPQDHRMWRMRYLENREHYEPGGPIFIYVGGEWTIGSGSISEGSHIYDLAKELNGIIYYTEHRYYGQSHPTNDTSTKNLQYLTVDQALADLAIFVGYARNSSPDLKKAGVFMVGGSYSGKFSDKRQSYRV